MFGGSAMPGVPSMQGMQGMMPGMQGLQGMGPLAMQGLQGLQPNPQAMCMELAKRMEDLYPVLQQASGQRVGAGAAHVGLHQSFIAYTYSFSDNPQLLQQANNGQFNPAVHIDYNKWAQAVQNNPAPQSCYPEPLVGLPAMEQRLTQQQQAVEQCNAELENLRTHFSNLRNSMEAQLLQNLEKCRQRHQNLQRKLLQVVIAVETCAVRNGSAVRNPQLEAQLEDRLAGLEEVVHAPAGARARLEELWLVVRGLLQQGPPAGGAERLAEADAEKTLRITDAQGELLELLQEEVLRRKRDMTQFESALARFANGSLQATQMN